MKTNSISFKLIAGGCLTLLIPMVITGVISITKTTNATTKVGRENATKQAQQIAEAMDMTLDGQSKLAAAFASGEQVKKVAEKIKNLGMEACVADIASLRMEMKEKYQVLDDNIEGIFVTNANGVLYTGELANGNEYKGPDVSERDYYKTAKSTGQATVGEIVRSLSTGKLIYVACAPVFSPTTKEFLGIFGISIKGEALTDLVSSVKIGKTGYAFMINKDGIANAHPNQEYVLQRDFKEVPGMESITQEMISGQNAFQNYTLDSVHMVAGFAPVPSKGWSIALTQDESEFMETPNSIRNNLIVVTLIAILVVGFLLFFASKSITGPLNEAVAGLKDIAEGEGNLTMRLKVESKDEIGDMASWFNTFIEKLQGIIKQIAENTFSVDTAASKLSDISEGLLSGAENSAQLAANVATASEEMSANLNSVAAAMEESSTNTNTVAAASEEMSVTINEIAGNAEKARGVSSDAVTQAHNASERMKDLGKAAEKIDKVTETITAISEQTNLLALNATIEAAQAGDAGRGFAVVAKEIKELAKQTADATIDIKNLIENVQNTTQSASLEIEQISAVITEINDIVTTIAAAVEEQSATTQEIVNSISNTSEGIQEVNKNVNHSSTVGNEISRDIADVNAAATKITGWSNEVKTSSDQLKARAADLNLIVGKFKV